MLKWFVAFAAALTLTVAGAQPQTASAIPENIRTHLVAGGVNLQFGFYNVDDYQPHMFDSELPTIAALGAGHVRIPLSFETLFTSSGGMLEARYQDVIAFVALARANNLVTIIDIHNTRFKNPGGDWNEDYMVGLDQAAVRRRHTTALTTLAARLYADNISRDWFVIQPANEPIYGNNPTVWFDYQRTLLPAIRVACPDCVVFAMANDWQGIDALMQYVNPSVAPYNDPLLVFDVHFYEPINASHCGYLDLASSQCNASERQYPGYVTTWRGRELWDITRLRQLINPLFDWSRQYGVTVHFSEIGTFVYMRDRQRYLTDLTNIIRAGGAGFSVYDWQTYNFGIAPSGANRDYTLADALFNPSAATPQPTATATRRPTNTPAPLATNTAAATPTRRATRTPVPTAVPTAQATPGAVCAPIATNVSICISQ